MLELLTTQDIEFTTIALNERGEIQDRSIRRARQFIEQEPNRPIVDDRVVKDEQQDAVWRGIGKHARAPQRRCGEVEGLAGDGHESVADVGRPCRSKSAAFTEVVPTSKVRFSMEMAGPGAAGSSPPGKGL